MKKYLKPPLLFIFLILLIFSQKFIFFIFKSNFSNKQFDINFTIKRASNFSYKLGSDQGFCFDLTPPCSNYEINQNILLKDDFYKFYYRKK